MTVLEMVSSILYVVLIGVIMTFISPLPPLETAMWLAVGAYIALLFAGGNNVR